MAKTEPRESSEIDSLVNLEAFLNCKWCKLKFSEMDIDENRPTVINTAKDNDNGNKEGEERWISIEKQVVK